MNKSQKLFSSLLHLKTESRNTKSKNLDLMSVENILDLINKEDSRITKSIKKEKSKIKKVVSVVVNSFLTGGRLIYVGAGTSGRLGILDAAECPPTFGVSSKMVLGLIAGGKKAVFKSQEGAEDNVKLGSLNIKKINVNNKDVVCGIAASLRTPFVFGALKEAKIRGAKTVLITTNPRKVLNSPTYSYLKKFVDISVCAEVGPEVLMGSTRMKSGTAQKLILNMITTTSFVRIGKTYENMMVDLQLTNNKLRERAKKIIMLITGVGYKDAEKFLSISGGHVKTAIIMIKTKTSKSSAQKLLQQAGGFVRSAIKLSEK
ncbi:MAG: N-acetylmuramic acid 6-phosphate etherase [Bacteroidetes bacterium]|nr:N-acetylmuramic acid 6-phosphate etherase [Bacteroidota bacterium]